jgi:transcriptional regulator with XRE-family HTH domain
MTTAYGPIVGRRRLRYALRQAREAAELTQDQVVAHMDWSLSKLLRIEAGTVSVSTNDVKALLALYRITDPAVVDELVGLARASRQRPWWTGYKERLGPHIVSYVGLEAETVALRYVNPVMITGLFQTPEYTRAIVSAGTAVDLSAEEIETLVELRTARQREILGRADPPQVQVVIDEGALRRPIGGPAVMREQLLHLSESAQRPHIAIRILPFSAGPYAAMNGPFIILEFPEASDTPVVFVENAIGGEALERAADVAAYQRAFERTWNKALSAEGSFRLIEAAIEDWAAG